MGNLSSKYDVVVISLAQDELPKQHAEITLYLCHAYRLCNTIMLQGTSLKSSSILMLFCSQNALNALEEHSPSLSHLKLFNGLPHNFSRKRYLFNKETT